MRTNTTDEGNFEPGQPVWARLGGYPWWPARIAPIDDKSQEPPSCSAQLLVYFFNDRGRSANLHKCCLRKFDPSIAAQLHLGVKRRELSAVSKAVQQATKYAADHGWNHESSPPRTRKGNASKAPSGAAKRVRIDKHLVVTPMPAAASKPGRDVGTMSTTTSLDHDELHPESSSPPKKKQVQVPETHRAKEEVGEVVVTGELEDQVKVGSEAMRQYMQVIDKHRSGVDAYSTMNSKELIDLLRARDLELSARKSLENRADMDKDSLVAVIVARDVEIRALCTVSKSKE